MGLDVVKLRSDWSTLKHERREKREEWWEGQYRKSLSQRKQVFSFSDLCALCEKAKSVWLRPARSSFL